VNYFVGLILLGFWGGFLQVLNPIQNYEPTICQAIYYCNHLNLSTGTPAQTLPTIVPFPECAFTAYTSEMSSIPQLENGRFLAKFSLVTMNTKLLSGDHRGGVNNLVARTATRDFAVN